MNITVSPKGMAEAILVAIATGKPICVWGGPGIGKTAVVGQVTKQLSMDLIALRLPLLDSVDLRGIPVNDPETRTTFWSRPVFLPKNPMTVLFLDEINRAPVSVQNSALQLLEGRVGEHEIPEGVVVIAACNPTGVGIQPMPEALANRFVTHIHVEPSLDDWLEWAIQNGIDPMVRAFLRFRPALLADYPKERGIMSFPTPRSWEFISRIVQARPSKAVEMAMVSGAVGQGAAIEFMAFLDLSRKLPPIESIIANPEKAPVPKEAGALYAVSAALAHVATMANFAAVLTYLDRLSPEYGVFAVRDALVRDDKLSQSPAFPAWAVKHQHVIV